MISKMKIVYKVVGSIVLGVVLFLLLGEVARALKAIANLRQIAGVLIVAIVLSNVIRGK